MMMHFFIGAGIDVPGRQPMSSSTSQETSFRNGLKIGVEKMVMALFYPNSRLRQWPKTCPPPAQISDTASRCSACRPERSAITANISSPRSVRSTSMEEITAMMRPAKAARR